MDKMNFPSFSCKIEIFCSVNPSEDPKKVESAILNIFPLCDIKLEEFSIKSTAKNLNALQKIKESIHNIHLERIYKRTLEKNLSYDSTWFYLNKQAAFAERVVICEESDESPLGPIKIVISSKNIERIIEWLTFNDEIG
jgi:predicted RNA binding protein with dsRBD fold (UPF0201 family)